MRNIDNGWTQAKVWAKHNQGIDNPASDGNRQPGLPSRRHEHIEIRANHSDRLGQYSIERSPASVGGIIDQLIQDNRDQLVELQERIERGKARIAKHQEKLEKIKARQEQLELTLNTWQHEVINQD